MGNNTSTLTCSGELSDCRRNLESAIRLGPELQTCNSNYRSCSNKLQTTQINYTNMIREKDALIKDITLQCESDISEGQTNIENLTAEMQTNVVACQQAAESQEMTITQLSMDLQSQTDTSNEYYTNLQTCDTSLATTTATLTQCNTVSGSTTEELTQCNTNLSVTASDLTQCNTNLDATDANLTQCNTTLDATEADLATITADLMQRTSELDTSTASLATRTTDLTQCNVSLDQCGTDLNSANALVNTQYEDIQDMQNKMARMTTDVNLCRVDLMTANATIIEQNSVIQSLQDVVATTQTALDQLTIENQSNLIFIASLEEKLTACLATGDESGIISAACYDELQVVKFNASNLYFYQDIWAQDAMGNPNTNPKQLLVGTDSSYDLTPSPIPTPDVASFVVTPALPPGLFIGETGALIGKPTQTAPLTKYRIDLMPLYGSTPTIPLATSYVRFAVGDASTCATPCVTFSKCGGTECNFLIPSVVQNWSTTSEQSQPVQVALGTHETKSIPITTVYRGDVVPPSGQTSTLIGNLIPFAQAAFITDNAYVNPFSTFEFAIEASPIKMTISATSTVLSIVQAGIGTWTYSFPEQLADGQEFRLAIACTMIIEMGLIGYSIAIALPNASNNFGFDPIQVGTVMASDVELNDPVNYTLMITTSRPMGWYALGSPRQLLNSISGLNRLMPMQLTELFQPESAPLKETLIGDNTVFLTTGGISGPSGAIQLKYKSNFNNVELKVGTDSGELIVDYGVNGIINGMFIKMQLSVYQQEVIDPDTQLPTGEFVDGLRVITTDTDGSTQTSYMNLLGTQTMKLYTFYFQTDDEGGLIQIRIEEGSNQEDMVYFNSNQPVDISTDERQIVLNWNAPIQVSTLYIN